MKISSTTYLHTFAIATMVLALVRCVTGAGSSSPSDAVVAMSDSVKAFSADTAIENGVNNSSGIITKGDTVTSRIQKTVASVNASPSVVVTKSDTFKPHRILSVPSYKTAFPDSNSVQMEAAQRYGVSPVQNRVDAEERKRELVYASANPYFAVDPLRQSIPYLVPRASVLLQDIGRAFFDSLYVKGVPLHKFIVTSVLRTEEDVINLRKHNGNASENSCHRYGTTFDICYNRYVTVQTKSEPRRTVSNDTLKWVLSEVLRDMREQQRCYIKYEVKQGCFHITTR